MGCRRIGDDQQVPLLLLVYMSGIHAPLNIGIINPLIIEPLLTSPFLLSCLFSFQILPHEPHLPLLRQHHLIAALPAQVRELAIDPGDGDELVHDFEVLDQFEQVVDGDPGVEVLVRGGGISRGIGAGVGAVGG